VPPVGFVCFIVCFFGENFWKNLPQAPLKTLFFKLPRMEARRERQA
jgi:hypothetical protein